MNERMTKENLEKKMNEVLKVEEARIRNFIAR